MSLESPSDVSFSEGFSSPQGFAGAALPLLERLSADILLAGADIHNLPVLVDVIERLDLLRDLAGAAGFETARRLSAGLSDLLGAVLCQRIPDPKRAMVLAADAFAALRAYANGLADGNDDKRICLSHVERILAFLATPNARTASASGRGGAEEEGFVSTGLPRKFEETEIYREFADECEEHLQTVEKKMLALEHAPGNAELIAEIFRSIHSVKGGAGFLGLAGIDCLANDMETLLDRCRKKDLTPNAEVVEVCLQSVDALKGMIANLRRAANSADPCAEKVPPVVFGPVRFAIRRLLAECGREDARIPPLSAKRFSGGDAPVRLPRLGEILVESGEIAQSELETALQLQDAPLGQLLIETGRVRPEAVEKALERQRQAAGAGAERRGSATIRVDTAKIDNLVNLAGELVVLESQVAQDFSSRGRGGSTQDRNASQLGKIAKELHERSLSLRTVPVRPLFQRMARLVRDSCRKAGKQAELVVSGQDIELDRTIVERIADPLLHILRNCVDHGIETPQERLAQGKPAAGLIALDAFRQGDRIAIRVKDDGRGLDRNGIVEKAVQTGLLKPDADPSEEEICALVFEPGFTTARQANEFSGRGVGMDVVRRNVEDLRGTIEIASVQGGGLTLTIRLPLTLAVVDGMIARIGPEEYVIPTASIVESLRPRPEDLSADDASGEAIVVRGARVPLVRLYDLWGICPRTTDPCQALVVIVEENGRRASLMADEVSGQRQFVVKSLGRGFRDVHGWAGAAVMSTGRVGLILDVDAVLDLALSARRGRDAAQETTGAPAESDGRRQPVGPAFATQRYLTCNLAGESYGIPVRLVREIVPAPDITRVPGTARWLKGLTDLRGQVVPVIDLRLRLGLPEISYTGETCVVVVETPETLAGLIADRAEEVVAISGEEIEPPPCGEMGAESGFLEGIAKAWDRTRILLDCEEMLRRGYDAGQYRAARPSVLQVRQPDL